MKITFNHRNDNPNTVWNQLAKRLGRQPTMKEAEEEVLRIIREVQHDRPS